MQDKFIKIPIVMAAFGTTRRAMETYSFIDNYCKKRFPGHDILWAFSSRMVKDWSKKRHDIDILHPYQVLNQLEDQGHKWAVVQSMHLMCGHEFYRLVEEIKDCEIRTSVGLPLLCEPEDYQAAVTIFSNSFPDIDQEAVIMVGHGTDHPGWCTYLALNYIFSENFKSGIYVGVVEKNGYPPRDKIIQEVKHAGYKKVRLIPFMLVAGMHVEDDLAGSEDSWQKAFEEQGISVFVENKGLGFHKKIIELYCRHIENALDVIPGVSGNLS
ncbi:Anaerobic cobalt chelatase [Desulfonema limicola]|uniref:Anaerobic cobalt chelatase n=1 Tax=Desulfonema limicola TaxID=45656 RepID=A0A975GIY7_9BACT|nr:sirohydrochlorin cobaltochelatase [Desulfonema limicola]QTA82423.1 Anaerobic cobalt chelatase [Desulfonema limicola]